ncbi:MAG: FtsX-like permease family protein, partial [Cellulomonas sp.]
MSAAWAREVPALALHRARAQAPLLAAVTATALVALTVLAACGLLLTAGRRDALDAALAAAGTSGTQVVARVVPPVGADAGDADDLAPAAAAVVADALAPLPATASTWTESPLLALPEDGSDDAGYAYLTDAADLADAARLVAGSWPGGAGAAGTATGGTAPVDVAVPAATAAALDLAPGDTVDLAPSPDAPAAAPRTEVRVVGVFEPLGRGDTGTPVWQRDLLGGAGVDPEHPRPGTSGRKLSPAYGPLVVAPGALPAAGTGVGVVTVTLRPGTAGVAVAELEQAGRAVARLRPALADALGDRADRAVVRTAFPATVRAVATQHAVAGAAALTAGLVVVALATAALLLAGRLLAARRAPERALLLDRGARRGQLLGLALGEAAAVVAVAAALAVPLGLAAYRALAAVPLVARSGVGAPDGVPGSLVATVGAGAAGLLLALVAPAARPPGGR